MLQRMVGNMKKDKDRGTTDAVKRTVKGGNKPKADTFLSKISIGPWEESVRETVFLRIGMYFHPIVFQDTLNTLINRHLFDSCDFQCPDKHVVFEQ